MVFAIFGINLVFGTILEFFLSKFSKKDHLKKENIENKINYLIWCHWTQQKNSDNLSFMIFVFDFSLLKKLQIFNNFRCFLIF